MINYIKGQVPGDEYFWDLFDNGDWEAELLQLLAYKLKPDSVYVDIGSWIGPTVLTAAQYSDHVYAVEPDEVAYPALLKNIEANPLLAPKISTDKLAIMNYNGWADLGVQGEEGNSMSSVLSHETTKRVRCIILSNYLRYKQIDKVDMIKIDTEGAELYILPQLAAIWKDIGEPTIHLSIHKAFFKKERDIDIVTDFLDCFNVGDKVKRSIQTEDFNTIILP